MINSIHKSPNKTTSTLDHTKWINTTKTAKYSKYSKSKSCTWHKSVDTNTNKTMNRKYLDRIWMWG